MRRWHRVVLLGMLVTLALAPAGAAAKDAQLSVEDFAQTLEQLHADCAARRFKKGLARLKELLVGHTGKPYVRAFRAELEDVAERLSFGARFDPPKPASVTKGKIDQFDPATGKLKLRWTKSENTLKYLKGYSGFPALLRGPFTCEIRGKDYPTERHKQPQFLFGGLRKDKDTEPGMHLILAGDAGGRASLHRIQGGAEKMVSRGKANSARPDRAYRIALKVTEKKFSLRVNGRGVLDAKRDGAVEGWLHFKLPGWESLTFSGTIEPEWIQSQLDKIVQGQMEAFRSSYKPRELLPSWLYKETESKAYKDPDDLPTALAKKHQATYIQFGLHLAALETKRALAVVDSLAQEGADPPLCDYLRAVALRVSGQSAQGLASIERCLAITPEFLLGTLMKARFLARLGRDEEAMTFCHRAIEEHPDIPLSYEAATEACLLMGRPRDARGFTAAAAGQGIYSERLDHLATTLTRALYGPNWARSYQYKSTNYHVISDIDTKSCRQAARVLEKALSAFRSQLQWTKREKGVRYRVCLFSGKEGFARYAASIRGGPKPPKWAAGLYSPTLKQLLIWNLPSREEMLSTIRHEGFHQYMDSLMSAPPVWFNEGLAVYHENADDKYGRLKFGQPHPAYARVLADKGLVPLQEFLSRGRAAFYADASRSYAQAWAFLHMLKHGDRAQKTLFKTLMDDLREEEASVVMQRHFTPLAVADLDRALRAYVKKLPR